MSNSHDVAPDPPLSADHLARVSTLTVERVAQIDAVLLSHTMTHWRKVAEIVSLAMDDLGEDTTGIPDLYLAQRVKFLVERGKLEAQGDLSRMRYSEVRSLHSKSRGERILIELQKLVTIVETEWKGDLPSAPSWFGLEGERVYELSKQLVDFARVGNLHASLTGLSIFEYLGSAWLDRHFQARRQVKVVSDLLKIDSSL